MVYLNGPNFFHKVKVMVLTALSPIIIAAEHHIIPARDALLQSFMKTIENSTSV